MTLRGWSYIRGSLSLRTDKNTTILEVVDLSTKNISSTSYL